MKHSHKKIIIYYIITCIIIAINLSAKIKEINWTDITFEIILFLVVSYLFYYIYNRDKYIARGFKVFKAKTTMLMMITSIPILGISIFNIYRHQNISVWIAVIVIYGILNILSILRIKNTYNKLSK